MVRVTTGGLCPPHPHGLGSHASSQETKQKGPPTPSLSSAHISYREWPLRPKALSAAWLGSCERGVHAGDGIRSLALVCYASGAEAAGREEAGASPCWAGLPHRGHGYGAVCPSFPAQPPAGHNCGVLGPCQTLPPPGLLQSPETQARVSSRSRGSRLDLQEPRPHRAQ